MKATIFDGSPAGDPTGERIAGLLTPLLSAKGYEVEHIVVLRDKTLGHCRGCGVEIGWWKTPTGKKIPLNTGSLEPHWATCPKAKDFRK